MAPLMMGLACVGDPLIRLMLTEKWLPCVPYLRIFCVTYMFYPIHTANLSAIKAMGRSDLFLKLEIVKKIVGLSLLLVSMQFGVLAMAYSLLISTAAGMLINSYPNRKLLNYSFINQMKDILPGILLAVFMGLTVYCVQFFGFPDVLDLALQIPLGAAIFIAGSKIFHLESYLYIKKIIKMYLRRGKKAEGKQ